MSTVSVNEQSIAAALRRLSPEQWPQVLAYIDSLQPHPASESAGNPVRRWTATELRRLPPAEREAILERQEAALETHYRNDPDLTAFEAFGDEDLHVDSSDSAAR